MYALVEFVDDSEKEIVDVSSIKRFDSENVGYNKKYKVLWEDGNFYDAFILIIGETIEEVQKKKESTRIRKPNRKFADSDVATSSEAELDAGQKKKKENNGFAEQFQNKMLQIKAACEQETTVPPTEAGMSTAGLSTATETEEKKEAQQKGKEKKKGTAAKQQQAGSSTAPEGGKKREAQQKGKNTAAKKQQAGSSTATEKEKKGNLQKEAMETQDKPNDTATKHEECKAKKSSALPSKSLIHSTEGSAAVRSTEVSGVRGTKKAIIGDSSRKEKETRSKESSNPDQPLISKPKITSIKSVDNIVVLPNFQSHSTKQHENSLKKTISSITAENERYKKLLKEKDEAIAELKERNINLQVRVIAEFDELRGIIRELRQLNVANVEHRENNALFNVGYRRETDNTIHIGRNVWLSCTVYDSIVCISRSNAQFVKNCAIAIFGTETLMSSSVTGSVSNRTRKTKNEPARPKLDSEKLLALKDIYQHYLQHTKKLDEVAIGFELSQVGTFVSQKIYELNRVKTKKQTPQIVDQPDPLVENETVDDNPADDDLIEDEPAENEPADDEPMESDGEIIDGERDPDTYTDEDD